ncbi:hypothetical protein D3C80_1880420 [compost metagenome]
MPAFRRALLVVPIQRLLVIRIRVAKQIDKRLSLFGLNDQQAVIIMPHLMAEVTQ